MKGKLDIKFEWNAMGVNSYIPFIVMFLLFGYAKYKGEALSETIPVFELIIPIFSAWWSIFSLQNVLEEEGSETIFSYPIERWKLGIFRVIIFFVLYISIMSLFLWLIDQWVIGDLFFPLLIQLGTQSFFFTGFGFLAMVLTKNTGWSQTILVIYFSTQLFTRGSLFPTTNVFLFNEKLLPIGELLRVSLSTIIMGIILWSLAQYYFSKLQSYR